MQVYLGNRSSSRIKDLVDLVIIASSFTLHGAELSRALAQEQTLRGLRGIKAFSLPTDWMIEPRKSAYKKAAAAAGVPHRLTDVAIAEKLMQDLLNPIIGKTGPANVWNPHTFVWE